MAEPSVKIPAKTSKDLSNAMYDDFKRSAVDAAKKRAVAQNVDYETFKNMVSVAHLKPLQAPNTRTDDRNAAPAWNFGADGRVVANATEHAADALQAPLPMEPPATALEFEKSWRRACPGGAERYRYLRLLPPGALGELFRVEIGAALLGEILSAMEEQWLATAGAAEGSMDGGALAEAAALVAALHSLAGAGRFGLTLQLLGAKPKAAAGRLFDQLAEAARAAEEQAASGAVPPPGPEGQSLAALTVDRVEAARAIYLPSKK